MRTTTYLTLLAAPLALAACGSGDKAPEPAETMMSEQAPTGENAAMPSDMPMEESAAAGKIGSGTGSVTEVDQTAGKITIDHGPIEAVGWPAMTMAFSADKESLNKVKVGDRVKFEFRTTEGGGGELTAIAKQ